MAFFDEIKPITAFRDNYIWACIYQESIWLVDPGEADAAIDLIQQSRLQLKGIFVTHHHHDHCGGVNKLLSSFPDVKVYSSEQSPLPFITHRVKENDEIICGNGKCRALEIPGHTLDHTAFYDGDALFCGDTLFSVGCGRVFEGTPDMMYQSLMKLKNLPDATKVFCGHEYTLANLGFAEMVLPENVFIKEKIKAVKALRGKNLPTLPSVLGEEKKVNPFLRCDEPEIIDAAQKYAGEKLGTAVEVFAVLREWKNNV